VARLERLIWNELDAVAALALKVRGRRLALPLGLLQLRPPARPRPRGRRPQSPGAGPPAPGAGPQEGRLQQQAPGLPAPGLPAPAGAAPPGAAPASAPPAGAAAEGPLPPGRQQPGQQARTRAPASYRDAASDGMDVRADVHYPALRRAARLSYAVAAALLDLSTGGACAWL
jgi:hypothetical protein